MTKDSDKSKEKMKTTDDTQTEIYNLSSRKLWELLTTHSCLNPQQQQRIKHELRLRGHYLQELNELDIYKIPTHNAQHTLQNTASNLHPV